VFVGFGVCGGCGGSLWLKIKNPPPPPSPSPLPPPLPYGIAAGGGGTRREAGAAYAGGGFPNVVVFLLDFPLVLPWLINQIPLEFWPIWFSYWFSHWLIILYYIIFFIIKIPWEGGGVIRGPAFHPLPAWGAAFPPSPAPVRERGGRRERGGGGSRVRGGGG
jgi:hypothetical protein